MSDWPATDIATLRSLWDLGLSTAEIGRRMGRTKCSVVGKAHRLDLQARPDPIIRDGRPRSRTHRVHRVGAVTLPTFDRWCAQCGGILGAEQARFCSVGCDLIYLAANRPPPKPKAPKPVPKIVEPTPPGLRGECCFPIGEPRAKSFRFCGEPTEPGKPYCGEHWRATHVPSRHAEEREAA